MSTDAIKQRWAAGGTVVGAFAVLRDPLAAESLARAGFDYVVLDMQHGLADFGEAARLLQVVARTPAAALVRVPGNRADVIGRVLDAGAMGVVVPMVNSAEEAAAAVRACRYHPLGERSIGPAGAAALYGPDYAATANDRVLCIPMVETRQAVERVDEIVSVPGVDAVYVGPSDLSLTYGLRPGPDNPGDPFDPALAAVVDACRRHGVVPGIHANAQLVGKRQATGFRMITITNDLVALLRGAREDVATARGAVEEDAAGVDF